MVLTKQLQKKHGTPSGSAYMIIYGRILPCGNNAHVMHHPAVHLKELRYIGVAEHHCCGKRSVRIVCTKDQKLLDQMEIVACSI